MKVLFDQGTPVPLRNLLSGHNTDTAFELGWQSLGNGELLAAAETHGYEVFVTTDQNLRYQQNLVGRRIAIVALLSTSWPRIANQTKAIQKAIDEAVPAAYLEIDIP